jgi:hypothetical protein
MALKIKVVPTVQGYLQINHYKILSVTSFLDDGYVETSNGDVPLEEILNEADTRSDLVKILRHLAAFIESTA